MYSLTVSLCYELKDACDKNDKKFDNKVNNLRFAMDNFDTELVVMGIKLVPYTILFQSIQMKLSVLMSSMSVLVSIFQPHRAPKAQWYWARHTKSRSTYFTKTVDI